MPRSGGKRSERWVVAEVRRAVTADRGTALITALITLTIMGFFLIGFQQLNQSELVFAGYSRADVMALNVAEAGVQEAMKRLNLFGATPGVTCFLNSMTTGATCASSTLTPNTNTVAYQAPLSANSSVFPILSTATVNGATRAVRILERATLQAGYGDIILAPQVTFQGDASPVTGDTYATLSIVLKSLAKSPAPGTGATATNLVSPQELAGTTVGVSSGGPGTFTYECGNSSTSEVAPTACTGQGGRTTSLPVNWHPMVPIGMTSADFTTIMNNCYPAGCATAGVTISQATQSGTGVTYTPVSYSPSYWSLTGANSKVWLAKATGGFCVNSSSNTVSATPCTGSAKYYGTPGSTTRFLDWGLVQDDQTRGAAQTFFQAPSCTAPCANAGNQNGIRYIPLVPQINVLAVACNQNINPGVNAFYDTTADGKTCANPPTVTGSTTFSGTKTNPEYLVIDNGAPGGTPTQIFGSINSGNTGCSTPFDNYNWGVIIATGDLDLQANLKFTGFIYTPGNVFSHGNVAVNGGIFSANDPGTGSQVNEVDDLGTVNFCGGEGLTPLSPSFYTFTKLSWEDRPAGQP